MLSPTPEISLHVEGALLKKHSWPHSVLWFSLWGGGKQNFAWPVNCFSLSFRVRCLLGPGLSFASLSYYLLCTNSYCHQVWWKKLPVHYCLGAVGLISWFCELILVIRLPEDPLILVYQSKDDILDFHLFACLHISSWLCAFMATGCILIDL